MANVTPLPVTAGTVTMVATSGAGISGGPISAAGTLAVQWNAGLVNVVTGATITSGTLAIPAGGGTSALELGNATGNVSTLTISGNHTLNGTEVSTGIIVTGTVTGEAIVTTPGTNYVGAFRNSLSGTASLYTGDTLNSATIVSGGPTLSGGNLTFTGQNFPWYGVLGRTFLTSGKAYFEVLVNNLLGGYPIAVGVGTALANVGNGYPGEDSHSVGYAAGGGIYFNGGSVGSAGVASAGTYIQVAVDITNKFIWFSTDNTHWNSASSTSANPGTGTGGISLAGIPDISSGLAIFVAAEQYNSGGTVNTGATAFQHTPPSGFATSPSLVVSNGVGSVTLGGSQGAFIYADGSGIVELTPNTVSSVFGRTGVVTLQSADVIGALGYTPIAPTGTTNASSADLLIGFVQAETLFVGAAELSIAAAVSFAGAYATTLTVTGSTALTLPTSGTLDTVSARNTAIGAAIPAGTTAYLLGATGTAGLASTVTIGSNLTLNSGGTLSASGSGGGSSIAVELAGTTESVSTLNFSTGLAGTVSGSTLTVTASGGGGSGTNTGSLFIPVTVPRPAASAFTAWDNQSTGSLIDNTNGPLTLTVPIIEGSSGSTWRGVKEAVPGSTPWTATARLNIGQAAIPPFVVIGMAVEDSSGKIAAIGVGSGSNVGTTGDSVYATRLIQLTNSTTWSNSPKTVHHAASHEVFLRIYNDGTYLHYQLSPNGATWNDFYKETVTAYLGTQSAIGLGAYVQDFYSTDNENITFDILGWEVTTGTGTNTTWVAGSSSSGLTIENNGTAASGVTALNFTGNNVITQSGGTVTVNNTAPFDISRPALSTFTGFNTGSGVTTSDIAGGPVVLRDASLNQWCGLVKTPPTGSWTLTAQIGVQGGFGSNNNPLWGLIAVNSSNAVVGFYAQACASGQGYDLGLAIGRWSNPSTWNSSNIRTWAMINVVMWFKLVYNSSAGTLTFYTSIDGFDYDEIGSETVSGFLGTIASIGFGMGGSVSSPTTNSVRLYSWSGV